MQQTRFLLRRNDEERLALYLSFLGRAAVARDFLCLLDDRRGLCHVYFYRLIDSSSVGMTKGGLFFTCPCSVGLYLRGLILVISSKVRNLFRLNSRFLLRRNDKGRLSLYFSLLGRAAVARAFLCHLNPVTIVERNLFIKNGRFLLRRNDEGRLALYLSFLGRAAVARAFLCHLNPVTIVERNLFIKNGRFLLRTKTECWASPRRTRGLLNHRDASPPQATVLHDGTQLSFPRWRCQILENRNDEGRHIPNLALFQRAFFNNSSTLLVYNTPQGVFFDRIR